MGRQGQTCQAEIIKGTLYLYRTSADATDAAGWRYKYSVPLISNPVAWSDPLRPRLLPGQRAAEVPFQPGYELCRSQRPPGAFARTDRGMLGLAEARVQKSRPVAHLVQQRLQLHQEVLTFTPTILDKGREEIKSRSYPRETGILPSQLSLTFYLRA